MDVIDRSRGLSQYGPAYKVMLENDTHAPGSVDRAILEGMVCLSRETADILYSSFTPLDIQYVRGAYQELEAMTDRAIGRAGTAGERVAAIIEYCHGIVARFDALNRPIAKMRFGGTEADILSRGTDWCADIARAACALCQVAGIPARIADLFDTDHAYSGHVIIEAWRDGAWGAADPWHGVVYSDRDGKPATTWALMNEPALVERIQDISPDRYRVTPAQFRAAGIMNYFIWERSNYDYTVSGTNDYYRSILEMSVRGWPGGLRWLHGEDLQK